MTRRLTERQREVLAAIDHLTEPRGPTVRELCVAIGARSTGTAQRHIDALEDRGLVSRPGGYVDTLRWRRYGSRARGVTLTEKGRELLEESR